MPVQPEPAADELEQLGLLEETDPAEPLAFPDLDPLPMGRSSPGVPLLMTVREALLEYEQQSKRSTLVVTDYF